MSDSRIDSGRVAARLAFLLVLGLWIGAMVYFAAVAAPAAFAALADQPGLPGRQLAGSVVRIALGTLNQSGVAMAVVALVLLFLSEPNVRNRSTAVLAVLVIVLGVLSFVAHGVVSARLDVLRTAMGVIDEVAVDDPRRLEFGRLHGVSVLLLAVQILVAVGVFVTSGWRWLRPVRD
ncbi:MAG: DUF4149 domain-containing protein [Blastocatellia bacterium]|nr:DUF4149 domain-containing protein [Blastocatellia bacterium]